MSPNRRARRALSLSLHNQRFPRVHREDNLLDSRRAHAIEHSRDDSIPGPGVGSKSRLFVPLHGLHLRGSRPEGGRDQPEDDPAKPCQRARLRPQERPRASLPASEPPPGVGSPLDRRFSVKHERLINAGSLDRLLGHSRTDTPTRRS